MPLQNCTPSSVGVCQTRYCVLSWSRPNRFSFLSLEGLSFVLVVLLLGNGAPFGSYLPVMIQTTFPFPYAEATDYIVDPHTQRWLCEAVGNQELYKSCLEEKKTKQARGEHRDDTISCAAPRPPGNAGMEAFLDQQSSTASP